MATIRKKKLSAQEHTEMSKLLYCMKCCLGKAHIDFSNAVGMKRGGYIRRGLATALKGIGKARNQADDLSYEDISGLSRTGIYYGIDCAFNHRIGDCPLYRFIRSAKAPDSRYRNPAARLVKKEAQFL